MNSLSQPLSKVGLQLALFGCVALCVGVLALPDLRRGANLFVVLALTWGACSGATAWSVRRLRRLPWWVLGVGLALRLTALGIPPELSDDLFRYLWEGRVQLAGENPFLHAPDSPTLQPLRDSIQAQVNNPGVSTIYPPGALWLFRAVAALWYQPMAWKLLSMVADLGVLAGLVLVCQRRGVAAWAPALYATHPLPILESAASGHLESLALAGLVAAIWAADRGKPGAASVAAWAGALIKVLPGVVLIPLLRRGRRAWVGALLGAALGLALAAPFLDAGPTLARGFGRYYDAWSFNAAAFPLLQWLFEEHARLAGVGLGALWCARAAVKVTDPAHFFLHVSGALLLLSPVVHPWYVLWALVPALMCGRWAWAVLASTCLLSYQVLASYDAATGAWTEAWWIPLLVYPPLLLALGWQTALLRRSPDSGFPKGWGESPSRSPTGPAA